jgi:uncharacterized protein (TIGR02145 family)
MRKKNNLLKLFLLFVVSSLFVSSCKKDNAITSENNADAEVNFAGAVSDPTASFTPFQLPSGGGTSIPASYDLTSFMPPVRNQKTQGSCVGFCLANLKSYHERLEFGYTYSGDDKIMSPAFIYNQVKAYPDCGSGSNTINALNFLKQKGVSTESDFPYNVNNCSNYPSNTVMTNALKNKIREWQGFTFLNNSNVLYEMKFAISQMQPVVIDFKVDAEFTKLNLFSWGTIIWKENTSGDPTVNGIKTPGYHCALLVGYDDSKNAFKLLNSWGTLWKNDGYCWVDYAWFLKRVRMAFVTWDEFSNTGGGGTSFTDSRDGNVYNTVLINGQTWLTENLRFNSSGSLAYNNDNNNVAAMGRLYNYNQAVTAIPSGWHIPTDDEWKQLEQSQGMSTAEANTYGDRTNTTVINKLITGGSSGLNLKFSGYKPNNFFNLGIKGHYWTGTSYYLAPPDDGAYGRDISNTVIGRYGYSKSAYLSLRLVKN